MRAIHALPLAFLLVLPGCPDETSEHPADSPDSAADAAADGTGSPADAAGDSPVSPDDAASPCPGLDWTSCTAQPRCQPVFGRTVSDPFHQVYAGCWTAYQADGTPNPYLTYIACGREDAGSSCLAFLSDAIPDGWQQLLCSELPEDCGATAHPANTDQIGHCESLLQGACQTTTGCTPVSFAGGDYAGCRSTVDLSGNPITDPGPSCGRRHAKAECYHLSSTPPDGWIIEGCSAQCE